MDSTAEQRAQSIVSQACSWSHYFYFWDFFDALKAVEEDRRDALVAWPAPTTPEGVMVLEVKEFEVAPPDGATAPDGVDMSEAVEDMARDSHGILPTAMCAIAAHVLPFGALFDTANQEEANLFRDLRKRFNMCQASGNFGSFLSILKLALRPDCLTQHAALKSTFSNLATHLGSTPMDDIAMARITDLSGMAFSLATHDMACRIHMLASGRENA